MQTSFMHHRSDRAVLLRSVAPAKEFLDRVSGRKTAPVTTGQIYWGAVPFVLIQIVMVGLIIAFPNIVSAPRDQGEGRYPKHPDRDTRRRDNVWRQQQRARRRD